MKMQTLILLLGCAGAYGSELGDYRLFYTPSERAAKTQTTQLPGSSQTAVPRGWLTSSSGITRWPGSRFQNAKPVLSVRRMP